MNLYEVYEAVLTDVNKDEAPVILLEDFNYLYKKAVYQYCNLRYNVVEKNQQALDDLALLYASAEFTTFNKPLILSEYMHSLGCTVEYEVIKAFKQYKVGDLIRIPAARYRADYDLERPYFKPSEKRAYYRVIDSKLELFTASNDFLTLHKASLEYLKLPKIGVLTDEDLNGGGVASEEVPFGEYQTLEIINIISKLLLENAADPRVQTFTPINQTIQ